MRSSTTRFLALALFLGLVLPPSLHADEGETAPAEGDTPAAAADPAEPPEPLLWVVEGEPTIYLFGTIHIPDPRVKNFSTVLKRAIESSDVLWTELDMSPAAQMQMQAAIMKTAFLTDGRTIKDVLSEALYKRLEAYLQSKDSSIAMMSRLKPWFAAMTLQTLELLPQMAQGPALDAQLYADATQAGKDVGGLETLDEQIGVFTSLSDEEQEKFLSASLDALEKVREGESLIEQLTKLYLLGKTELFQKVMYEEYDPEDPMQRKFMKLLIDDRNVRMVDRMLERSAEAPEKTYFVAVGTAHYPGETGILKLLEQKGKTVRRLKRGDTLDAKPAPATTPPGPRSARRTEGGAYPTSSTTKR